MLLHFVSVSGFMEAGRTVDIMAEEGRRKKIEEQTNTTPDDGSSSQCLYFSQSFHWKNLYPNNCKLNWMCFCFGIGRCIVLAHLVILDCRFFFFLFPLIREGLWIAQSDY